MNPASETYFDDCIRGMAQYPDGYFDLAVTDPPYGRGEHGGKDRSGLVRQSNGTHSAVSCGGYSRKDWDKQPAPPEYFTELSRVSKNQIIWGCNYFQRPFGPGRIVWDKCNDGSDQSGAEIAYNSLTDRVDLFRFMWRGMLQGKSAEQGHIMQGNKKLNEKRIHPTQKPVALYRWVFSKFAQPGDKILDTHLGSQSSRIAAFELGLDFYGFENDRQYFDEGNDRFGKHVSTKTLFHP